MDQGLFDEDWLRGQDLNLRRSGDEDPTISKSWI
jgi:hypothetical protein